MHEQRRGFERWGIMGAWGESYHTMQPAYEAAQLGVLRELVARGLIYHGVRPVHWSPATRTALAEAELEVEVKQLQRHINHTSVEHEADRAEAEVRRVADALKGAIDKGAWEDISRLTAELRGAEEELKRLRMEKKNEEEVTKARTMGKSALREALHLDVDAAASAHALAAELLAASGLAEDPS